MTHKKGLLPSDIYPVTFRQSYKSSDNPDIKTLNEDTLVICLTVNSGDLAWQNLVKTFDPNSELDMWNLQKMAKTLNFNMYDKDHPEFYDQWVGLNARIKVTVDLGKDSRFKQNIILEYMLPRHEPEIDILKPKDNSHFYQSNKHKRKLPI